MKHVDSINDFLPKRTGSMCWSTVICLASFVCFSNQIYAQCSGCSSTVSTNVNLTVASGQTVCLTYSGNYTKTITLNGGTLCISSATTIASTATITNTTGSTINNYGTFSKALILSGTYVLNNYGTFNSTLNMNGGTANNKSGGTFSPTSITATTGSITNEAGGSATIPTCTLLIGFNLYNYGTMSLGVVTNNSGATITFAGTSQTFTSDFTNKGTVNLNGALTITGIYSDLAGATIKATASTSCNSVTIGTNSGGNGTFNGNNLGLTISPSPSSGASLTNGASGPLTTPSQQPTTSSLSLTKPTVSGSFTSPSASITGYIVLRYIGTIAPSDTPIDNSYYIVGSTAGSSTVAAIVASASTGTKNFTDNISGISNCGKKAYYRIFSFNGSGTCRKFYKTNPLKDSITIPTPIATITPSGATTFNCPSSLTLTGSSASSYLWSTTATTSAISVSTTGTYAITITDAMACTASASTAVTVNGFPTPSINSPSVCVGATATLTATGGISYVWNTGATTTSITSSSAGTYTVTATNAASCTATASGVITTTNPSASAIGTNITCNGSSDGVVTLTPSGGSSPYTYVWNTGVTTQNLSNKATGTYTVTVTDSRSCTATASATLTQPAILVGSATTSSTSCGWCLDGTATINVTGGTSSYTYLWNGGSTSQTRNTLTIGTYYVTITDSHSCTDTIIFAISGPLTASIAGLSVCSSSAGSATVNAFGGTAPYTYLWNNGSTSTTLSNLTSGTYTVTVRDAASQTVSQSVVISNVSLSINASPTSSTLCSGNSVQLTSSGGTSYAWSPTTGLSSSSISNPLASPTSSTIYTITVSQSTGNLVTNGDFSSGFTGFTSDYFYESPAANTAASGKGLWPEGYYAVDANANTYHTNFTGLGHGGSGNFLIVNGAVYAGQNVWTQTVNVTPNNDYSFSTWVSTLNTANPTQLKFSINGTLLGTAINGPTGLSSWIQFSATWNSGSNTSAVISIVNNNTIANGNDFGLDDISFTTTCSDNRQVNLTVNPLPIPLVNSPSICSGSIATLTATGGSSYVWNNSATTSSITTSSSGTYTVTATNSYSCSATASGVVTVNSIPIAPVGTGAARCGTGSLTISATPPSGCTIDWYSATASGVAIASGSNSYSTPSLSTSTNYFAETRNVTTGCLSPARTSVTATINTFPSPSINNQSVCAGATATLTASGGNTYLWNTASTSASINTFITGTYTVTATSAAGCSATASTYVSNSGQTLTLRGVPAATAICTDILGWTYYSDPLYPDSLLFAIYKNGNTFEATVTIRQPGILGAVDINADLAHRTAVVAMGRYWNVTIQSGSIDSTKPVKARFFYNPIEYTALQTAAQTLASSMGLDLTVGLPAWFKTSHVSYDTSKIGSTDIISRLSPNPSTINGTLSGLTYVEYTGLTGFSGGTAAIRISPNASGLQLPVKLLYFTADTLTGKKANIRWATATEVNNDYFEVQRSSEGTDWSKIGDVKGIGNSSQEQNYSLIDQHPFIGVNYYRLKQVDADTHFEYSPIAQVAFGNDAEQTALSIYPNPTTQFNGLHLQLSNDLDLMTHLTILDVEGKIVYNQDLPNEQYVDINHLDFGEGVYFVRITTISNQLLITRIVVE